MTPPPILDYIEAMRADHLPAPQSAGLWYIKRDDIAEAFADKPPLIEYMRHQFAFDRFPSLPLSSTALCRWTTKTLNTDQGEAVMSDDPRELRRHLPAVLAARGRVLVTGLGLGCVVRGLLANPAVEHIDVVEIDLSVLAMVAASVSCSDRVTIHHDDALAIRWRPGTRWDLAWHDVWSETPETQVLHAQLLRRYEDLADVQGAWGLPRFLKRVCRRQLGAAFIGGARRTYQSNTVRTQQQPGRMR